MIVMLIDDVNIKPYVRMTRRGKYVNPQAQEYLASQEELKLKMQAEMTRQGFEKIKRGKQLHILARFYVTRGVGHRCDLDNLLKALLDALQGIVIEDDRWVDHIETERIIVKGDTGSVYFEVLAMDGTITEMRNPIWNM